MFRKKKSSFVVVGSVDYDNSTASASTAAALVPSLPTPAPSAISNTLTTTTTIPPSPSNADTANAELLRHSQQQEGGRPTSSSVRSGSSSGGLSESRSRSSSAVAEAGGGGVGSPPLFLDDNDDNDGQGSNGQDEDAPGFVDSRFWLAIPTSCTERTIVHEHRPDVKIGSGQKKFVLSGFPLQMDTETLFLQCKPANSAFHIEELTVQLSNPAAPPTSRDGLYKKQLVGKHVEITFDARANPHYKLSGLVVRQEGTTLVLQVPVMTDANSNSSPEEIHLMIPHDYSPVRVLDTNRAVPTADGENGDVNAEEPSKLPPIGSMLQVQCSLSSPIVNSQNSSSVEETGSPQDGSASSPQSGPAGKTQIQPSQFEFEIAYETTGLEWDIVYCGILNDDATQMDLDGWFVISNGTAVKYDDAVLELHMMAPPFHRKGRKHKWGSKRVLKHAFSDVSMLRRRRSSSSSEYTPIESERPVKYRLFAGKQSVTLDPFEMNKRFHILQLRSVPAQMLNLCTSKDHETKLAVVANMEQPRLEENDPFIYGEFSILSLITLIHPHEIDLPAGSITIFRREKDSRLGLTKISQAASRGNESSSKSGNKEANDYSTFRSCSNKSNASQVVLHNGSASVLEDSQTVIVRKVNHVPVARSRTKFKLDSRAKTISESFEFIVGGHSSLAKTVEVVIEDVAFRWFTWEVVESSIPHQRVDEQKVQFRVAVSPGMPALKFTYTLLYKLSH